MKPETTKISSLKKGDEFYIEIGKQRFTYYGVLKGVACYKSNKTGMFLNADKDFPVYKIEVYIVKHQPKDPRSN